MVQATDSVPFQPIVAGRYYDRFARDTDGWDFTERKADVEMVGDVSDHLLIDPHQFDHVGEPAHPGPSEVSLGTRAANRGTRVLPTCTVTSRPDRAGLFTLW